MREVNSSLRVLFEGSPELHNFLENLEPRETWEERISIVESMVAVAHPSLVMFAFILIKKSLEYFREKKS